MSKSSRRPPEEDKPARRSWRGSGNGSAKAEAASFGWRQGRAPRNEVARKWLIGVPLIVGVLGLFAAAAYVIFQWPTPTPLVCLFLNDYEAPLAPQAFAQEDVEQLQDLFRPSGGAGSIAVREDAQAKPSAAESEEKFLDELLAAMKSLPPDSWRKKPQLVYLSAQGVVNAAGEPCLVLAAGPRRDEGGLATPSQVLPPSRLVSIEKVIATVATAHNNPKHRIVLLLDCVRWDRNWRLGMASNPFAEELKKINLEGREHVAILHATSDDDASSGEVGLVDLRQGHTLFGKFVARGLAGEADGSNAQRQKNGDITLDELHAYLSEQIGAAAAGRGRRQRPLLVKSQQTPDFVLAKTDSKAQQAVAAYFQSQTFQPDQDWLDEIHDGWAALDQQRQRRSSAAAPAESLLSEESQRQHWPQQLGYCLAGKAYRSYRTKLVPPEPTPGVSLPGVSLPLAFQSLLPTTKQQEQGKAALKAALLPPAAEAPAVPAGPPGPQPAAVYREVAWSAWQEALDGGTFSAAQQDILDQIRTKTDTPALVELGTLARFSPHNPHLPAAVRDATQVLRQFLLCRENAERAAFLAGDARALPLLRTPLDETDQQRRQAEDRLFGGQIESETIAAVQQKFRGLESQAQEIARAWALRDRVWADLPYLLEWVVAGDAEGGEQAAALLQALQALEQALAARSGQPVDWSKLTRALDEPRRALLDAYQNQWDANVARTAPSGHVSQFLAMERLLSAPLDQLSQRPGLWTKYWQIVAGGKLDEEGAGGANPGALAQRAADTAKQQRAAATQLLSQWLGVAGAEGPLAQRQQQVAAFAKLMDDGAAALAAFDVQQPLPSDLSAQLARREPASRAVASWLTMGLGGSIFGDHAIGQHAQQAAYDYCLWRAQRSLDDFSGSDDRPAVASVPPAEAPPGKAAPFAVAAEGLIAYAERSLFPRRKATAERTLLAGRISDANALRSVALLWPTDPLATGQTTTSVERVPEPLGVAMLPAGEAALWLQGDWKQITAQDASGTSLPAADQPLRAVAADKAGWPARFELVVDPDQPGMSGTVAYYYRGHAWSQPAKIKRLEPRYRLVSAAPGDAASVAVDSATVKANIMIMLDCSNSMNARSGLEGNRLDRGRNAVKSAIEELLFPPAADAAGEAPTRKQIKLSLVYFGHRRGTFKWPEGAGKTRIAWNAAFGPDTGVPWDRDFDRVFNSRDFTSEAKGQEALGKLLRKDDDPGDGVDTSIPQPTGFTPLYAAMDYALNLAGFGDVDAAVDGGPRHLLVVSDGDDQIPTLASLLADSKLRPDQFQLSQFNPPWSQDYNSPQVRNARAASIRGAMKGDGAIKDVNLYFFDVANDGSLKRVQEDLNLKAEQIVPIGEDIALKDELLRRIGVRKYVLLDRELAQREFGSSTRSRAFPRSIGRHVIQFDGDDPSSRKFRIGGGEKLELSIPAPPDPLGFQFVAQEPPLADDKARGKITLAPGTVEADFSQALLAYDVQCRAQRGKQGERDSYCEFDLVFQNSQAGEFTPRPAELWVEITPQGGRGGSGPAKYTFCNPFPRAGTRAPVYRLTAPLWPPGAGRAQVAVWVRTRATSPVEALSVTSASHGQRAPAGPAVRDGVLLKFDAREDRDGAVAKITEVHPTGAGLDDNRYFVVPAADLDLKSLTQVFYDGQVEHLFLMAGNADDARRATFLVMPQAQWKKSATPLDGALPLEVTIP